MSKTFAGVCVAAALFSSTAAWAQGAQPLSATAGENTVSADASSVTFDPRAKRVTIEIGDNKPIVVDGNSLKRAGANITDELRRLGRRTVEVSVDVVDKK